MGDLIENIAISASCEVEVEAQLGKITSEMQEIKFVYIKVRGGVIIKQVQGTKRCIYARRETHTETEIGRDTNK